MNKIVNFIKTFFAKILIVIKRKKIDEKKWVFSSTNNSHFNYNSKYLFEYVLYNEPDIHPIFVINDDSLRKQLACKYGENHFTETKTLSGIFEVLSSGVWFTSAGLPVYGTNLSKDRKIINLWHGVPLKKIALQEPNCSKMKKRYFKKIFSNNYTYILTTSNNLTDIMSESFGVDSHIIKNWGQPRNDLLYEDVILNLNKLEKIFQENFEKDLRVLYAPTHREQATQLFPFEDFEIDDFLYFLEKYNITIFIRTHISEENRTRNFNTNRINFINEDKIFDIMEIINVFDLLITDYSSIYIDYLLLERPIIFLPYDIENYTKDRGFNFDYHTATPGPKPSTYGEFKDAMRRLLLEENYYRQEIKKANDFFNDVRGPVSRSIVQKVRNR